jgi:type I restriction enzyme S subunit
MDNNLTCSSQHLRFPGFEGISSWEEKRMGDIFVRITKKNKENNKNVLTISAQYGLVSQYDYFNKNVASLDVSNYYLIKEGDFAYNKSRSQGYPYGAVKPLLLYDKGVVSPLYICFRLKENEGNADFFRHYFETDLFNNEIAKIAQEGARNHGLLNISSEEFFDIQLRVPSIEEQGKIAKGLSSIDELIYACNEKLELLKAHKKGLMQQLLAPINGGGNSCVTPTLRFPKFKNTKGWEIKKLKDIAFRITVKNKSKKDLPVFTNSASGGIVNQQDYFDREIVTKDNLVNYSIVEVDDFVCNPRISTTAPVGPISRNRIGHGVMSPLYTIFRFSDGDIDFFEHYFKTNCWHQYMKNKANFGARFDRMNITNEDFMNMPIPFPPIIEQKQIAESFSSIDEVIEIYSERVAISKQHKIGLMQQLFPKQVN